MTTDIEQRDTQTAARALLGRRITGVRYMTAAEAEAFGWRYRPLVIDLDDGSAVFPIADEAMNEAAALLVWAVDSEREETVLGRHAV
jgi:hypothetical protein